MEHWLARAISGAPVDGQGMDAQALFRAAMYHGVYALLQASVHAGTIPNLPAGLPGALKPPTVAFAAFDLVQQQQVGQAVDTLATAGVRSLLVKGLAMALLHYPESRLRHRTDADIWVDEADIDRTIGVLDQLGYTIIGGDRRNATVQQLQARTRDRADVPTTLDIHWGISNRTLFQGVLEFEREWNSAQPVKCLSTKARALSNPALLIHASFHRLAHDRSRQRDRLFWLNDIRLLLSHMTERDRAILVTMALEKGVGAVCADAIESAATSFGIESDPALTKALNANRRTERTARLLNAGRVRWLWEDWRAQPTAADRWRYGLQIVRNRFS